MGVVQLVNLLAAVTLIEMMVSLGLGVRASDVLSVGKQWDLLSRAFLANYVIVPGAALGLLLVFHASPMVAAGFLGAAVCPGAPYAPPFTSIAKGDVSLAVGLMVVLSASSAILAPVLLGFLLPLAVAHTEVKINILKMIGTLLGAQLLPLCVGLWIRDTRPLLAERLKTPATALSLGLNLLLLIVIISVQFQTLAEIHLRGYIGMMCLVLATLLAGSLVTRRPQSETGKSMIVTTCVRNVGVSLVIATASFPGTAAITSATAYAIFQTVTIAMAATAWGRLTPDVPVPMRKAA
ncbi:MAG TPA: bile acid:sodium symporter [Candidatus Sulfotelmatobacter sp.]|jgi:BASS family bile acid:Na+ symporter|nr:bile acid:sodium symporter [Candidatus Sulfotelmatobacter sp.]